MSSVGRSLQQHNAFLKDARGLMDGSGDCLEGLAPEHSVVSVLTTIAAQSRLKPLALKITCTSLRIMAISAARMDALAQVACIPPAALRASSVGVMLEKRGFIVQITVKIVSARARSATEKLLQAHGRYRGMHLELFFVTITDLAIRNMDRHIKIVNAAD